MDERRQERAGWRRPIGLILVLLSCLVAAVNVPTTAGASIASRVGTHAFAGYAAAPATVSSVSADITVPAVTCTTPKPQDLVSIVEIMGSNTVTQAGVNSECMKGSPIYFAGGAAGLVTFHLPVNPGDVISIEAKQSLEGSSVSVTDTTSSLSDTAHAPGATAARVQIGDLFNRQSVSIPTFTTETFSSAMVDGSPLATVSPTASNMRGKHRTLLISTGGLSTDGTSFTTTFVAN